MRYRQYSSSYLTSPLICLAGIKKYRYWESEIQREPRR
jgi:hypothetical protein